MIEFVCPHCRKAKFRLPDNQAGKRGTCPKCHKPIQIPGTPHDHPSPPAPVMHGQVPGSRAAPAPAPGASQQAQALSALATATSASSAPAAPAADWYYRPPRRVSKGLYLFSVLLAPILLVASILVMVGGALAATASGPARNVGALPMVMGLSSLMTCMYLLAAIYGGVMWLVLLYKMWASIPRQSARTSPGLAVGLLFVPVYNLAWVFTAYYGFAADYNQCLLDGKLRGPRMSLGVALCVASMPLVGILGAITAVVIAMTDPRAGQVAQGLLFFGSVLAGAVLHSIYVSQGCNAVNFMAHQARMARV